MYSLSFKMFLRRGVAASSVLAIALLVAIVSSTNAVVDYLNFQSETLAGLVGPHGTYLVLRRYQRDVGASTVHPENPPMKGGGEV